MSNTAEREFWLIQSATGQAWQVTNPASWCLHNAHEPILAPARDRLVILTCDDADRIIRLVVRRCGLNLVEIVVPRVIVHFWGQGRQADVRPLFKRLGLARQGIEVLSIDRKRELVIVRSGSDFLYGDDPPRDFPWTLHEGKWHDRWADQADDGTAAPGSVTNFFWEGVERGRIPWTILKRLWTREEPAICPNCDLPLIVRGLWFVWSKSDLILRCCFRCHKNFDDRSEFVLRWIVRHLEPDLWPSSHDHLRASIRGFLKDALARVPSKKD